MEILSVLDDLLVQVAILVVTVILLYAWRYVKAYLVSSLGTDNYKKLTGFAETVVRALEQQGIIPKWTGEQKKEMAVNVLRQLCEKYKLDVDDDTLDMAIEEAVQILNTEQGKFGPQIEG